MANRTCTVVENGERCLRPHVAKGFCQHHYDRRRTYGDPLAPRQRWRRPKRINPETWFWQAVDSSGGPDACWPWKRGIGKHGYGVAEGHVLAHRQAWVYANNATFPNGPNGEPLDGCHLCHNRSCCNPTHIIPGTRKENIDQMWEAGRQRSYSLAGKTHCRNGHEYTPENTYIDKIGKRHCRECNRAANRRWEQRQREHRQPPNRG